MVRVFLPHALRDLSGGRPFVEVTPGKVQTVIQQLEGQFPGIAARLCQHGRLVPGLAVSVNGRVSALGLLQEVPDDTELHFLPAIGGG